MVDTSIALGAHPPKPDACLRIGVTGHRELGDAENQARIKCDVEQVLSILQSEADDVASRWSGCFASEKAILRLISPLATGADSLVADVALEKGYDLQAALPFPLSDYRKDFDAHTMPLLDKLVERSSSVFELHGARSTPKEEASSYFSCGRLVLRQSDILIAVWDGEAARGIGGTAMIIESALRNNVPVIWVHANEDAPPAFVTDDFGRGGDLTFVKELAVRLIAPPFAETSEDKAGIDNWRSAEAFWNERQRRTNYGMFFGAFETILLWRRPAPPRFQLGKYAEKTSEEWSAYFETVGDIADRSRAQLAETLAPRFSWADNLALYYAKLYRSSYTMNYLLASVAVGLALAEIVVGLGKEVFIAAEIVVILSILGVTVAGQRGMWHEKWIDYRQLAEQLRHIRFLYLTGGASSDSTERHDYSHGGARGSWVQWYFQASVRQVGLARVSAGSDYLRQLRKLFVEAELKDQSTYHAANIVRTERIEHALHSRGNFFFLATLLTCVVYLVVYALTKFDGVYWANDLKYAMKSWVTVLTAFLPAIGASMQGIRVQGEFSSTAERSEAMKERLEDLAEDLKKLDEQSLSLSSLQTYVESAAETMLIEVVDWRFVFRGKPITLPA